LAPGDDLQFLEQIRLGKGPDAEIAGRQVSRHSLASKGFAPTFGAAIHA